MKGHCTFTLCVKYILSSNLFYIKNIDYIDQLIIKYSLFFFYDEEINSNSVS